MHVAQLGTPKVHAQFDLINSPTPPTVQRNDRQKYARPSHRIGRAQWCALVTPAQGGPGWYGLVGGLAAHVRVQVYSEGPGWEVGRQGTACETGLLIGNSVPRIPSEQFK